MKHNVVTCVHLLVVAQWRLVDAELNAGTKIDATARRSSMDLGCAQCESGREARGAAERSARCKQCMAQGAGDTRHKA
jgi:hypothetical protein